MNQKTKTARAFLMQAGEEIAVDTKYASRYSILVRFPDGDKVTNGAEFEDLAVLLGGRRVTLGPCRLIHRPDEKEFTGSLVFTHDIYDYHELFFNRRIVVLQSEFANLPIILERKSQIRQEFKDYTSDLTYSLSVYRNIFDAMDAEFRDEPDFVRESIQQAVMAKEGVAFLRFFDDQLQEMEHLVADYSREEHERHGFYFRRQVWSFILASALIRRTNLKPRGYSGDYEIMRMIYLQEDLGDSIFSKLMHRHPIESAAAKAVRNRCEAIVQALRDARRTAALGTGERLKVLSVACGPAFELNRLLGTADDCVQYEFTLLDQDPLALLQVGNQIETIERRLGRKVKVQYLHESVRTMMSTRRMASRWGQFDLIYSMGLLDYLTAPVAKALITNLYKFLQPGGEMIIGNCHTWNPIKVYMEYWGDWALFYRKENELLKMVQDLPDAQATVTVDDMDIQMLLRIKRLA